MEISANLSFPTHPVPQHQILAYSELNVSPRSKAISILHYGLLFGTIAFAHAAWTIRTRKNHGVSEKPSTKRPVWYNHLDPFLGLDILVMCGRAISQGRLLEWSRNIMIPYGRTVSWLYFGKQAVLTIDPLNLKAILSSQFEDFGLGSTRKNGLQPLFGDGIFNSDGATWKSHRTVLRPFLSRVRDVELAIFENHVQDLLKVLPKNGTTVDIQPVFASFTLDVSTNVFLGTSTNLLSSNDADQTEGQEFAKAFDHAQRNLVGLGDSSVLTTVGELLTGHRLLHQSLDTVNKFVDKILDRSLQQREITSEQESLDQPHDESLLDTLLRTGRSRINVKQDIINLVVAGKDSTAAYLSSIWYMLSKYPDAYQKLRDEIGILENKPPTKEDLHRFPYLQMVLQEVLRLFPPVALNQRTAVVDTILPRGGGPDGQSPIRIRRGASVGYSVYAMHRLPEFFGPDADEFRPERWSEIRPQWAYMPFHAGPRTCLGKQFALTLVKYCTIRLMQEFPRPQDRNDRPWQEKLGVNCSSLHGVKVGFESQ